MKIIDLRSDTVTRPSEEMREFIYKAEVGDDVFGEDPSVNKLQEKVADLLGKEAGLFVTSGTMGNQLCIKTHTNPYEELICEKDAHIINYESGSIAGLSHVQVSTIKGTRGSFGAKDVEELIRPRDAYYMPKTKIVCAENTHNRGGGSIFPIEKIREISELCKVNDLIFHLDGARLWNASIATGISLKEYGQFFDSVSICLSKGLGAPVGSVIAGKKEFIRTAHRYRKAWGGGMRQAGILAAAGLFAVNNNFERIKEDHRRAKYFAEEIAKNPNVIINPAEVETNLLFFEVKGHSAETVISKIKDYPSSEYKVLFSVGKKHLVRGVTHLDISDDDIQIALETFNKVFPKN